MRDREAHQNPRRLGKSISREDAAKCRIRASQELVPKFRNRLDINRLLVLALNQKRVAVQVDKSVDLLDRLSTGRHVVGVLRLQLVESEGSNHQMLKRFP